MTITHDLNEIFFYINTVITNQDIEEVPETYFDVLGGTNYWVLNDTFFIEIGGRDTDNLYFHGTISRLNFHEGYEVTGVGNATFDSLRRGIPKLIYALEFNDPILAQTFRNEVENQYPDAVNGSSEYSDISDLNFVRDYGWSRRYWNQYVSIP